MHTYSLDIISIDKKVFSGFVKKIQVPGSEGELEILPKHISFLTFLRMGMVFILTKFNEKRYVYLSGGILEVYCNVTTILADIAICAEDIDGKKVRKSIDVAERNMKKFSVGCKEYVGASVKFFEESEKLRVVRMLRGNDK